MADIDVTISSNDERFFNALEHPEGFMDILAVKAEEIGGALVGELEQYPKETEANAPGRYSVRTHRPMGFYERGRGWWYPIMRMTTIGDESTRFVGMGQNVSRMRIKTIAMRTRGAGKQAFGAVGYKLRDNSEQLKENWVTAVVRDPNEVLIQIGNLASYASNVQGYDQSALLRKYGWTTIEDVLMSPFYMEVSRAREQEALMQYYHLGGFG